MLPNPISESFFGDSAISQRQNLGDYLSFGSRKVVIVHAQERDHSEEADTFVPIAVWVVLHETESIGRGKRRDVRAVRVLPLLSRPRQSRFEDVLVPNACQASVFTKLIVVDGVDDEPRQPQGL